MRSTQNQNDNVENGSEKSPIQDQPSPAQKLSDNPNPNSDLQDSETSGSSLNLQTDEGAKLVCIFGKRGSGKTTAIGGQIGNCRPPVVIIDILGNFDDPEFFQTSKISEAIAEIKRQIREDKFRAVSLKTPDPDLAIDYMSATLWETGGTLIIDEADAFSFAEAPCFDHLIRYGRNQNVSIITGCRRPAEISRNITAGANKIFVFKTNEPRDIDYFREFFGPRAEELMRIERYNGLYIDHDLEQIGLFKTDEKGHIYILKSERY